MAHNTATIVREDVTRFDWAAVLAGAIVATAVTFFLISVGSGLGLALTTERHATGSGIRTFLTLGAIYFVAAQAFGLAVGGHITGRLMGPAELSEEENFRADAHGLGVWALAVVFGIGLVALAAGPGLAAGATSRTGNTPVAYWADKLFRPTGVQQSSIAYRQYAQNGVPDASDAQADVTPDPRNGAAAAALMPSGARSNPGAETPSPGAAAPTMVDVKAEASRILAVDGATGFSSVDDKTQLVRLVAQATGLASSAATDRVNAVEDEMKTAARQAADASRKAATFVGIWTALALLFGAVVSVASTLFARSEELAKY